MTYAEKLKDPRWQKKRLEILERDNWACFICGDKETTLHVHHEEYVKGREPWEAVDYMLTTLCENCHEVTHKMIKSPLEKFLFTALCTRMRNGEEDIKAMVRCIKNIVNDP